jgi:hypothetical protein
MSKGSSRQYVASFSISEWNLLRLALYVMVDSDTSISAEVKKIALSREWYIEGTRGKLQIVNRNLVFSVTIYETINSNKYRLVPIIYASLVI